MDISKIKRITPQMGREAYVKSGAIPIRGVFYDEGPKAFGCCAITALILADHPELKEKSNGLNRYLHTELDRLLGLDEVYSAGFINGFDRGGEPLQNMRELARWKLGFEDGFAVWRAVQDLIPKTEESHAQNEDPQ